MRNASSHISSLEFTIIESKQYASFVKHISGIDELKRINKIIRGIPKKWIDWAEEVVDNVQSRGIIINSPINYRMNVLLNGIINLQEGKYICDTLENSLRHIFNILVKEVNLNYDSILTIIPNCKEINKRYENNFHTKINITDVIDDNYLTLLTFYELYETISRLWKEVNIKIDPSNSKQVFGFSKFFWHSKINQDVNLFRKDMVQVKGFRNSIAHSNKLIHEHEIIKLFQIANKWLQPLNVDISSKVEHYRKRRPRFLEDLENYYKNIA